MPDNGQVERMNRTIKDATVKRYHYESHDQLRAAPAPTSSPPTTTPAGSRPCAASRPTKPSAKHGRKAHHCSPQTRTTNCRDQTSRLRRASLNGDTRRRFSSLPRPVGVFRRQGVLSIRRPSGTVRPMPYLSPGSLRVSPEHQPSPPAQRNGRHAKLLYASSSTPDPASGFMAAMITSCTALSCAATAAVSDSRR